MQRPKFYNQTLASNWACSTYDGTAPISNLKSAAEDISRQLREWADSLQNSKISGQRCLNEKARRTDQSRKDRDEFLAKLERVQRGEVKALG